MAPPLGQHKLFATRLHQIKNKDLSSLMMKARPASKGEKAFDAVTLVSRTNAHGGMPSMTCGAQNLGKSHRFEFTATYTFWK